jgi:predicted HicB family RNase H-like nuclease
MLYLIEDTNHSVNWEIKVHSNSVEGTMLNHRGYTAIVKLDPISKVLKGKVIDLKDSITFESSDVDKLMQAFERAVDSYLEFCRDIGKSPEKPFSGNISYRTDSDTHRQIVTAAAAQHKSTNAWMDEKLRKAAETDLSSSSGYIPVS